MIPDKESWCDSLIPLAILEAIDVIRNQLRTPRLSCTSYVYLLIQSLGNYLSNLTTIQQYGFGFNPCSARCSATDLCKALWARISVRLQLMRQAAPVVRPEVLERVRPFSCKRFQVPLWFPPRFPHCIESKIAAYSVVLNCT